MGDFFEFRTSVCTDLGEKVLFCTHLGRRNAKVGSTEAVAVAVAVAEHRDPRRESSTSGPLCDISK